MESKNTSLKKLSLDYERVEKAIEFIEANKGIRQPSLSRIAESVNLSEFHFQRLFSRWVGISIRQMSDRIDRQRGMLVEIRKRQQG
jgi:AraC family transcriptional regulator of adaptative response/methylated-DNA-[protein]-cysteine methyltransferase